MRVHLYVKIDVLIRTASMLRSISSWWISTVYHLYIYIYIYIYIKLQFFNQFYKPTLRKQWAHFQKISFVLWFVRIYSFSVLFHFILFYFILWNIHICICVRFCGWMICVYICNSVFVWGYEYTLCVRIYIYIYIYIYTYIYARARVCVCILWICRFHCVCRNSST